MNNRVSNKHNKHVEIDCHFTCPLLFEDLIHLSVILSSSYILLIPLPKHTAPNTINFYFSNYRCWVHREFEGEYRRTILIKHMHIQCLCCTCMWSMWCICLTCIYIIYIFGLCTVSSSNVYINIAYEEDAIKQSLVTQLYIVSKLRYKWDYQLAHC